MLTIIHGDNPEKTFNQTQIITTEYKNKGYQIKYISTEPLAFTKELTETGLFETKKLIVVNNFKSLNKKDLSLIKEKKYNSEVSIVISSSSPLTSLQIKSLGKPDRIINNTFPKLLWAFLDSFYPGNSKSAIKLFNNVVKTEAPELVVFMLIRHLKDLFLIKSKSIQNSSIPLWKLSKLKSVADKYDKELLKGIIAHISEIDIESKSTEANLKASIDLLIISKLQ